MHKRLFIPGPVDVRPEALEKMATPQIGHRTKEATELQKSVSEKAAKVFQTKNTIILSTSSGTGLMEGAVRSFTKKRAAVFSTGAFGDKFYKLCIGNGIPADKYKVEAGKGITVDYVKENLPKEDYDLITLQHNETSTGIMNPVKEIGDFLKENYPDITYVVDAVSSMGGVDIKTDEWGADVMITSTQKCIGLPAGMAIASVTDRAIEKAKTIENRGVYFDYVSLYDKVKAKYQYPSTPSLAHMYALDYQLGFMLEEEGLKNRFARHEAMAKTVREFAEEYFELLVKDEKFRSNTVTCILNTRNIDVGDLNKKLAERGFMISNGYGDLKDKTFRIAHMADAQPEVLDELLKYIKDILGL